MPSPDFGQLTATALAGLALGAGAPLWSAVLMFIIHTLKSVIPSVVDGREKLWSFGLAGLLVAVAFYTALTLIPPIVDVSPIAIIVAILSWFTVARLTMATYDDLLGREKPAGATGERKPESVLHPAGWTG